MSATMTDIGAAALRSEDAAEASASRDMARDQPRRVSGGVGLDRGTKLAFTWNGRRLTGFQGDTLSSALLAAGVDRVGRSFKYHRPRGVTSAGVEEAGALVTLGDGATRTPNVNASTQALYDSAVVTAQNAWPSIDYDLMSLNGVADKILGPVFSAGFYYKTFFSASPVGSARGTKHWMWFEAVIRRAAGLGRLADAPDPSVYETEHGHCDVLVVGSGPAGLAAAVEAAEAGMDVLVAEQDFAFGGRLLSDGAKIEGEDPVSWRDRMLARLEAAGGRALASTCVFGLYDGGTAAMVERPVSGLAGGAGAVRERLRIVRYRRVVLATGAIERGLAFAGNDRPGVMTAGALRSYVTRFGALPGRKIAIVGADDGAFADVERLRAAGADVTLIDMRGAADAHETADIRAAAPVAIKGGGRVRAIQYARVRDDGLRIEDPAHAADVVAVSAGWTPTLHLLAQRGGPLSWDAERGAFVADEQPGPKQDSSQPEILICGAADALDDADACAESGRAAADDALGRRRRAVRTPAAWTCARYAATADGATGKSFVDLIHDVTVDDVRQAEQEGFVSVEHLKRYTTLGMAPDQGKTSNVIGLSLMAEARGVEVDAVGTTGFRPPYTPVSIGALAGDRKGAHYKPTRRTPMHDWHLDRGAVMTDAGLWRRPWYYPQAGETIDEAYVREAATVRRTLGICDVSTLGKILVQGPDAAEFLNRIYVNGFAKLAVGRARYGVMLRDDGVVFDDGTVWRLGEIDYLMTTTTTGAGAVMSWVERLAQTRWPELDVCFVSVSDAYAGFAVAGPLARKALEAVFAETLVPNEAFPPMAVRPAWLGGDGDEGVEALIARLSFSGERAYEVMVPADAGVALADALWDAVEPMGGCLYGTEALGTLRIEKGHVAGAELDGRTTLADLGLEAMASTKKPFVGQALSQRPAAADSGRARLVGLEVDAPGARISAGALLRREGDTAPDPAGAGHGVGWVSSVTYSPVRGRWIGLGFAQGGVEAWDAATLVAADPVRGRETRVRVVSPHFYDPEGANMKSDVDPAAPTVDIDPSARVARRSALGNLIGGGRPAVLGRDVGEGLEAPGVMPGDAGAWIVEGAPRPVFRVVAWPEKTPDVAEALAALESVAVLRLAPTEWWVVGGETPEIAAAAGVVAPIHDGLSRFRLGGARVKTLLNRQLPVDLRDDVHPLDAAARTEMHGVTVTLHRIAERTYDLFVPRSYASDFWDIFTEHARRM